MIRAVRISRVRTANERQITKYTHSQERKNKIEIHSSGKKRRNWHISQRIMYLNDNLSIIMNGLDAVRKCMAVNKFDFYK